MNFLQLEGKSIVVFGVANKKSVAYFIAKTLEEAGANVIYVVRSIQRKEQLTKLFPNAPIYICDVEHQEEIDALAKQLESHGKLAGIVHSIAFASLDDLKGDTVQTSREGFKMAMEISAYSLIAVANAAKDIMSP